MKSQTTPLRFQVYGAVEGKAHGLLSLHPYDWGIVFVGGLLGLGVSHVSPFPGPLSVMLGGALAVAGILGARRYFSDRREWFSLLVERLRRPHLSILNPDYKHRNYGGIRRSSRGRKW